MQIQRTVRDRRIDQIISPRLAVAAAPNAEFRIRPSNMGVSEALLAGRADLAIGSFRRIPEWFEHEPLFSETRVWVVAADHPAAWQELTLERLAEQSPPVARVMAARSADRADAATPAEFKVFIRGRDHTYLSRELPWTGPSGEPLGTIILLQDVTFIRDQERARANLIATLSHELKTPLTSLAIGAELLSEAAAGETGARQREILATIRDDVNRLQNIAGDLLDASRTSAARIGVERRPIILDRIVREVCAPLKMQADEKRVILEVSAGAHEIPIWGDPIKLPWVVTNLVGNALRYTPEGGKITIELQCEGSTARVIVSDTGPGIAEELLPRIFEPYAQFPDDPARAGSAGLGLYIAKEIVEAHNGRIFVKSRRGAGSTFIVEIPLREEVIG